VTIFPILTLPALMGIAVAPRLTLMAVLIAALLALMAVAAAAVAPLLLAVAAVPVPSVAARILRPVVRRGLRPRCGAPFGDRQLELDQLFDVAQERHFIEI